MSYDLIHHEGLITDNINGIICSIIPLLNVKLADSVVIKSTNPLTDYLEQSRNKPKAKQILHNLINCDLEDSVLLHTTTTPYSVVRIYGLSGLKTSAQFKTYIMEFQETHSTDKLLRCGVVCEWNMATAVNVNFTKGTEESINTANFILCELLHTASELNTGTESTTSIPDLGWNSI